ncbi:phosphate regulon sensor histidine kinase PhoR [Hydrocarboniclastica marina]|uniref:Phosphate regulon sensor protein PhoR n=1 Tax=Hydrocarboniclastica marina TaxID=2259620 RepID=A0A4P7XKI2_9ALTE|nr:phosphate regulon sensor histidine kinase PhoR [Hydrocarboniclastica marina]QCF27323.1 phosphate regulon sensor histidine kinase PhoR [Hydrocarboniclastica marina]
MHFNRKPYLKRLALYLFLASVAGLLVGQLPWVLLAAVSGYLFWTIRHALRLQRWLAHPNLNEEPPEARGLWGELFDGLYRMQRRHLHDRDRQQALVDRIQESTNSLRDGVVMTDARGRLEWWNISAERFLGLKGPVDQGQVIHNLIRAPQFRAYFEAKRYADPLELQSPAHPHLKLQFEINLFGDNDRLITVKDVSRLHHLESMRKDFVSNVSHELRTPLTVITGYLETLGEQSDALPPRWGKALQSMARQAARMDALVNDLILLAKLESDDTIRNRDKRTVVGPLLRSIEQDAISLSGGANHHIELTDEGPEQLFGDENQLRSAFSNIVFNAVRYSPPDGRIQLRWWSDSEGAHFSVRDQGDGIDPIHIPRLTERFYRADPSRHQDSGGTGLGLAIVKHVLLNHDGKLEIKSELGVGSEFICHLPTARIAEPGEPETDDSIALSGGLQRD